MAFIVGVSTLHGDLITVAVEPNMKVSNFKKEIMRASPWQIIPLAVNADLAHLMGGCILDDLVGIRVSTYDGQLLQDQETIGSQVMMVDTHYKLVFMKQHDVDHKDMEMVMEFANLSNWDNPDEMMIDVHMPHGTEFVVRLVWGGIERSNSIIGLCFTHKTTESHCEMKLYGIDLISVHHSNN